MMMLARPAWLLLCYGGFVGCASGPREGPHERPRRAERHRGNGGGHLLARSVGRATPLLRDAITRREQLSTVLILAGDTGDPRFDAPLRTLADDPDANVARAAADRMRLLQAHRGEEDAAGVARRPAARDGRDS